MKYQLENPAEQEWQLLYKIGGAGLLLAALIMPIQIIIFILWPPPLEGTAIDWLTLFQENKFLGLLSMDLLLIIDQIILIPSSLALYVVLRKSSQTLMAVVLFMSFVGIASYISSNTAINMLSLSEQYAVAASESQRVALLAAGEAMLATYDGTAFQLSYILQGIAGIIVSVVMLWSKIFSRFTAYVGILGGVIAFGLYVPKIGIFISIFSILFYEIWYILIARRLFQIGRN